MPRVYLLLTLAVLFACTTVFAQQPAPVPLDVLYVTRDYNTLQAYDVDPTTGIPNAVGQAIVLADNGAYSTVSPDDHFVYVLAWNKADDEQLRVYATDAEGSLQQPPVQVLNVSHVSYFEIDPSGKFAYAVTDVENDQGLTVATIWKASIDSETGFIGNFSVAVGASPPNGPCGTGWWVSAVLRFDGFSTDGTKFYYDWYCVLNDSPSALYFARNVDLNNGFLGSESNVFGWSTNNSADAVWFTPRGLVSYAPNDYLGNAEVVVLSPSGGGSQPAIWCTAEMLQACGTGYGAMADPAGVFMFLQSAPDDAVVTVIDLISGRLVPTATHIPQGIWQLSPDRILLYTYASGKIDPYYLTVYVFDPNTGSARQGGTIELPGEVNSLISAVRR